MMDDATFQQFSLKEAREYRDSADLGRSLGHYMGVLKNLECRKDYEDEFSDVLSAFCEQLEDSIDISGRGEQPDSTMMRRIEEFYQIGVELYPESARLWEMLGNFYYRIKQSQKSMECFFTSLSFDPARLMAKFSLHSLISNTIPHWHYKMINDAKRNQAYQDALVAAIRSLGRPKVLDIGTGTGILAIYAGKEGPEKVVACEESPEFAEIARDVCCLNNFPNIEILPAPSTSLSDYHEKYNLIVSEILDSGCLGEGVISTMMHAHEHLLDSNGSFVVIPEHLDIVCAAISCGQTQRANFCGRFSSKFGTGMQKQYDSVNLKVVKGGYRLVSPIYQLFSIDLTDYAALKAFSESAPKVLTLEIENGSAADAVILFFTANLFGEISIKTDPEADICWDQAVFPLRISAVKDRPSLKVEFRYDKSIFMSCCDFVDNLPPRILPQFVLLQWNDHATKRVYQEFIQKFTGGQKVLNLTDYVFDEGHVTNCVTNEIFEAYADLNHQNLIRRPDLEKKSDVEFAALCFCPVDMNGLMKINIMEKVQLDVMLFSVESVFPESFRVWGQVVESSVLLDLCRIDDRNCLGVQIDQVLKPFYTEVLPFVEPSTLNAKCLTNEFKVFEFSVLRCDEPRRSISIDLEFIETGTADAILVWFEWAGIVTKCPDNSFYLCAYVLGSKEVKRGSAACLTVMMQNGLFDFSLQEDGTHAVV